MLGLPAVWEQFWAQLSVCRPTIANHFAFSKPISAASTNIWPCHGCQGGGNLGDLLAPMVKSATTGSWWPGLAGTTRTSRHHVCTINSTISCTNGPLFLVQMIKTPPFHPAICLSGHYFNPPCQFSFHPRHCLRVWKNSIPLVIIRR